MEYLLTDEMVRQALFAWIIILTYADFAMTYWLLNKYTGHIGLASERNPFFRFIAKHIGILPSIIIFAALASASNTFISIVAPLWIVGFMFGIYTSTISYHYFEYQDVKDNEKMGEGSIQNKPYN
jgi:hypothetical protein